MWPPLGTLQVRLAEPGRSCKQVCQEEQLICEPSFFQHLNKDKDLARWDTHTHTHNQPTKTHIQRHEDTRARTQRDTQM